MKIKATCHQCSKEFEFDTVGTRKAVHLLESLEPAAAAPRTMYYPDCTYCKTRNTIIVQGTPNG